MEDHYLDNPKQDFVLIAYTNYKEHIKRNLYCEWWLTNRNLSNGDIRVGDDSLNHRNV